MHQNVHQMMLLYIRKQEVQVRTTVTLDDKLIADAKYYTGIEETPALLKAALTALIQREAANALARLGGTMPDLKRTPRRRSAK